MRSHITCLALLTLIFAATYSVNMVVAEMYFDEVGDIMQFILLKYVLGTLHHLLSPLAVLVSYPEVTLDKRFVNHICSFGHNFRSHLLFWSGAGVSNASLSQRGVQPTADQDYFYRKGGHSNF